MIDWLETVIFFPHKTIIGLRSLTYDESTGEILKTYEIGRRSIEGSYSSSIQVESVNFFDFFASTETRKEIKKTKEKARKEFNEEKKQFEKEFKQKNSDDNSISLNSSFYNSLEKIATDLNIEGNYDSPFGKVKMPYYLCDLEQFIKFKGYQTDANRIYSDYLDAVFYNRSNDIDRIKELGIINCSYGIAIRGNPAKFLQGHNLIGCDCIKTLVKETLKIVLFELNINDNLVDLFKRIDDLDFYVTRIDITRMYDLGNNQSVKDFIYKLSYSLSVPRGDIEYINGTLYVGKHSTSSSIKIYNKLEEFKKDLTRRKLKESLGILRGKEVLEELKRFADGKLRIETTFRKKYLENKNMIYAKDLQAALDNLFEDKLGQCQIGQSQGNDELIDILPHHLLGTYALWLRGINVKDKINQRTFRRHAKELLLYGINIKRPPLNEKDTEYIMPLAQINLRVVRFEDVPKSIRNTLVHPNKPYKNRKIKVNNNDRT